MKQLESRPDVHELLEAHDILVGTAHSFQGEERDIMFLSFALDDSSPSASFRFLDKEDIFNVAITLARIENRVFVSFTSTGRSSRLASRFLTYADAEKGRRTNRVKSSTQPCLIEIRKAVEALGIDVEQPFEFGGRSLDLLCQQGKTCLAIDLIGFPGEVGKAMDLDHHLMLRRAGIDLFPVAYDEWSVRREEILRRLAERLS